MDFEDAVVRTVKAERSSAGMTLAELATASGIPLRSVERYLKGERHMTVDVIYAMAGAFGMTGSQLFAEAERRRQRGADKGDGLTPDERNAIIDRVIGDTPESGNHEAGGGPIPG